MTQAGAVTRQLASKGAAYTLRRETTVAGANEWTRGAVTKQYYPCQAHERGYKPQEIKGIVLDTDVLIVIDPSTLSVTPRAGDSLALGTFAADAGAAWRKIVTVYTPREGAAVAVYKVQARA